MKPRKAKVPVSRDPAVVTARILDAAQAEFVVHGYEAASTNRICLGFGGSKATLFRYFPTKQALLEAVVQRVSTQWRAALDWRGIPAGEPAVWLGTFAERMLRWILGEGPIFVGRLGIAEGHKFPRLEQTFRQSAARPLQAVLARQLRRWHREGALFVPDPRRSAQHFLDLVVSGAVSRRLYGERAPTGPALAAHVASSISLFINGCRRQQGQDGRVHVRGNSCDD